MALQPRSTKIFSDEVVSGSGSATSTPLSYDISIGPSGFHALQFKVTGSGTVTFSYEVSADGTNYIVPEGAVDIIAGESAGDWKYIKFSAEVSTSIRIKVTETSGSDATVNAYLVIA